VVQKVLLARLQSIDGKPLKAVDLWAARCGVFDTSAPVSTLSCKGKIGVNLSLNAKLEPLGKEIEKFAIAFKEGAPAFIADLNNDSTTRPAADDRVQRFLRWGTQE